jgi:Tol biopolymer transport system component
MGIIIFLITSLFLSPVTQIHAPEVECSSQIALFVGTGKSGSYYLIDGETFEIRPILTGYKGAVIETSSLDWSQDGKQLLFTALDNDITGLYSYSPLDDAVTEMLTSVQAHDAKWSPDGQYVLYYIRQNGLEERFAQYLIVEGADGVKNGPISNTQPLTFRWRPMTTQTVYPSAYLINPDGRVFKMLVNPHLVERVILPDVDEPVEDIFPSPDAQHIAVMTNNSQVLWMMNLSENSSYQIELEQAITAPVWSPDGTHFAFITGEDFYLHKLNGDTRTVDVPEGFDHVTLYDWSPDGEYLLIGNVNEGKEKIYVIGTDGAVIEELWENQAHTMRAAWSPCLVE